ncbi:hypothetical protein [Rhodanobacter sp. L36]|uniref:hypothetical protein n=1 Tax=Rhodanobacter sp. L36 TaxID=1747221 RepID=UPI00131AFDB0|nr:hypothetical protein [Rhodanobacter sp. L36]
MSNFRRRKILVASPDLPIALKPLRSNAFEAQAAFHDFFVWTYGRPIKYCRIGREPLLHRALRVSGLSEPIDFMAKIN